MAKFDVPVGEIVTRMLAGSVPMQLRISRVTETSLFCKPPDAPDFPDEWEFDKATGAEIDDYLQWGPKFGRTGSFLKKEGQHE